MVGQPPLIPRRRPPDPHRRLFPATIPPPSRRNQPPRRRNLPPPPPNRRRRRFPAVDSASPSPDSASLPPRRPPLLQSPLALDREWEGAPQMKYHQAPTWLVLKVTFLLLAFCFTAMLSLAFFSSDFVIVRHVLLLVTIGTVLFVLISRFLAETGLAPVEQQMQEMGIHKTEATEKHKRK